MLTRVDVMVAETLPEAEAKARALAGQMEIYSDASTLIPTLSIREMMPEDGWNAVIPSDKYGECFRKRVAERLIVSWKWRKAEQVAIDVSEQVHRLIAERLESAGCDCSTTKSLSLSVLRRVCAGRRTR